MRQPAIDKLLVNEPALENLQTLRDRLGKPLIVRSAYRSPEHNRTVGGATRSKHHDGAAFDIAMTNHDPAAFEAARGSDPDRELASPLQCRQTAQRSGIPATSARKHRPDRPKPDHAPTFILDHLIGANPPSNTSTVIDQLRAVSRQSKIVAGSWKAARAQDGETAEADARDALTGLDALWDELFRVEQARVVSLLAESVYIGEGGLNIRIRVNGIDGLAREMLARDMGAAVRPRVANPRHRDTPRPVLNHQARRA